MKTLLDTHFILWIALSSPRLQEFQWIDKYRPWSISPVSFLEIQFLSEVGRVEVRLPAFSDAIAQDPRFLIDDIPVGPLISHALALRWTRDPFDRLLAAHSSVRRLPFCTVDGNVRDHHRLLLREVER